MHFWKCFMSSIIMFWLPAESDAQDRYTPNGLYRDGMINIQYTRTFTVIITWDSCWVSCGSVRTIQFTHLEQISITILMVQIFQHIITIEDFTYAVQPDRLFLKCFTHNEHWLILITQRSKCFVLIFNEQKLTLITQWANIG